MLGLADILAIVALASPVPAPRVEGAWVYIDGWRKAGDPGVFTSGAVVVRFCTSGDFVMSLGVLYRPGRQFTALGPDDGLEIYRGKWTMRPDGASVTYRLVDYEVPFPGVERALAEDLSTAATVAGPRLRMSIVSPTGKPWRGGMLVFARANTLPAPLEDRFNECRAK